MYVGTVLDVYDFLYIYMYPWTRGPLYAYLVILRVHHIYTLALESIPPTYEIDKYD